MLKLKVAGTEANEITFELEQHDDSSDVNIIAIKGGRRDLVAYFSVEDEKCVLNVMKPLFSEFAVGKDGMLLVE